MQDLLWVERGIAYRTNSFDSSRTTLVFVHGLGPTCSGWEPFERALETDFNILTYDLRGHGLSRKYGRYTDYSFSVLADDLQALLSYLDIKRCSIVSNSIGSLVTLFYLRHYPGKVQANLLISPLYSSKEKKHPESGDRSTMVHLLSSLPLRGQKATRIDYSNFRSTRDVDLKRMFLEIRALSLRIYLFYLYQMHSFSEYEWWSEIRVPTTIVHGNKDTLAPYEAAVELKKNIPGAKLVTLEGANHTLIINNRTELIVQMRALKSSVKKLI